MPFEINTLDIAAVVFFAGIVVFRRGYPLWKVLGVTILSTVGVFPFAILSFFVLFRLEKMGIDFFPIWNFLTLFLGDFLGLVEWFFILALFPAVLFFGTLRFFSAIKTPWPLLFCILGFSTTAGMYYFFYVEWSS